MTRDERDRQTRDEQERGAGQGEAATPAKKRQPGGEQGGGVSIPRGTDEHSSGDGRSGKKD